MFAHNPLHGSGQAALPHPALASGEDTYAMQGIGVTDGRRRKPASDEASHAIPKHAAFVAAPRQRAMPEPPHLEPKEIQRRLVPTASASRRKKLTRLNTRPARSPVNASTLLLRAAPHDSGPMWVTVPLSYDFCIHYTSPV
jgi:hypothetical protein